MLFFSCSPYAASPTFVYHNMSSISSKQATVFLSHNAQCTSHNNPSIDGISKSTCFLYVGPNLSIQPCSQHQWAARFLFLYCSNSYVVTRLLPDMQLSQICLLPTSDGALFKSTTKFLRKPSYHSSHTMFGCILCYNGLLFRCYFQVRVALSGTTSGAFGLAFQNKRYFSVGFLC